MTRSAYANASTLLTRKHRTRRRFHFKVVRHRSEHLRVASEASSAHSRRIDGGFEDARLIFHVLALKLTDRSRSQSRHSSPAFTECLAERFVGIQGAQIIFGTDRRVKDIAHFLFVVASCASDLSVCRNKVSAFQVAVEISGR